MAGVSLYNVNEIVGLKGIFLFQGTSDCDDPAPSPDNGYLSYNKNSNGTIPAGSLAKYTCQDGYSLIGPSVKVCNQTGEWLPLDPVICA